MYINLIFRYPKFYFQWINKLHNEKILVLILKIFNHDPTAEYSKIKL